MSVENGVASKAKTENSGTAYVEYSLDISFNVLDKVFVTKLTAYTTSCRIMFQPVGSTPQMKALLGNKSVPRYFVNFFSFFFLGVRTKSLNYLPAAMQT